MGYAYLLGDSFVLARMWGPSRRSSLL